MQTSNAKATLAKLFSLGKRISGIRAALSASVVSGISESESEDQTEYAQAYSMTKDYRMAQLEAEIRRAQAEEMAQRTLRTLK